MTSLNCWTDYPIVELGDRPGARAPIRPCLVLSWDGNKYAQVEIGGITTTFKIFYLYPKPQRWGEGPSINSRLVPVQ